METENQKMTLCVDDGRVVDEKPVYKAHLTSIEGISGVENESTGEYFLAWGNRQLTQEAYKSMEEVEEAIEKDWKRITVPLIIAICETVIMMHQVEEEVSK